MILLLTLLLCCVLLIVAVATCISLFVLIILTAIMMAGIVSTSVLAGIYYRSFRKGFKVLLMLCLSIAGAVFGGLGLLICNQVFYLHFTSIEAVAYGAIAGIGGGIISTLFSIILIRRLLLKFKQLYV